MIKFLFLQDFLIFLNLCSSSFFENRCTRFKCKSLYHLTMNLKKSQKSFAQHGIIMFFTPFARNRDCNLLTQSIPNLFPLQRVCYKRHFFAINDISESLLRIIYHSSISFFANFIFTSTILPSCCHCTLPSYFSTIRRIFWVPYP